MGIETILNYLAKPEIHAGCGRRRERNCRSQWSFLLGVGGFTVRGEGFQASRLYGFEFFVLRIARYLEVRCTYNLLSNCSYNPILSVVMGFILGL